MKYLKGNVRFPLGFFPLPSRFSSLISDFSRRERLSVFPLWLITALDYESISLTLSRGHQWQGAIEKDGDGRCVGSDITEPQASASTSQGITVEERNRRKDPTVSRHSWPGIMIRRRQLHAAELWQPAKLCRCHTASFSADWALTIHLYSYLLWIQCSLIIPSNFLLIWKNYRGIKRQKIHKNY